MKYGLIGCGRIATNHIKAALENNIQIVAICDLVENNMDKVLAKYYLESESNIKRYTDYREMIERESLDFISIATESGKHAEIALYCIERGIHVIIEKPMAMSIEDCNRIIKLSRAKNVKVSACHQNRFNQSVQKLRQVIDVGGFGKMSHGTVHVRWNRNKDYYTQAPWRGTWAQDGGALMNQCIHNADLLRWMMGDEITEVTAYTDNLQHDYIEAEDLGLALIKFKNGGYGLIEGTTNIFPTNLEETLYLFGTDGTVKAGGKSVNIIEEWNFKDGLGDPATIKMQFSENPPNVYGYGHIPLYADVIDAIRTDRPPYVDGEAGMRALELILGIYQSAATGKPISFPMEDCATIDFSGRFS